MLRQHGTDSHHDDDDDEDKSRRGVWTTVVFQPHIFFAQIITRPPLRYSSHTGGLLVLARIELAARPLVRLLVSVARLKCPCRSDDLLQHKVLPHRVN